MSYETTTTTIATKVSVRTCQYSKLCIVTIVFCLVGSLRWRRIKVIHPGHWRVFESQDPTTGYDNSHLIVMRELKEDGERRIFSINSNISAGQSGPVVNVPDPVVSADLKVPLPAVQSKVAQAPPSPTPQLSNRMTNLRYWCRQQFNHRTPYEQIPKAKLDSILVDQKHKLLFCQIPSVALTDWRKILLILGGFVNTTSTFSISGGDVFGKYAKNIARLGTFDDKKRAEMLKKYYKVMFVREPLERLVVSYKTKLIAPGSKYFHRAFGSPIIKKYRRNATAAMVKQGSSVKFAEFAQYIIDNERQGVTALNEHWEQYYKQCHPCLIDYHFVGTFEDAEKDTDFILEKIGAKKILKPPYIADRKILPDAELTKVYSQLSARSLNSLFKVYSSDYTLFNYQCPSYVHEIMKKENMLHDY